MTPISTLKILFFMIFLINSCKQDELHPEPVNYNWQFINAKNSFFNLSYPPSKAVKLTYNITFRASSCCPVIEFTREGHINHMFNGTCFRKAISNVAGSSQFYLTMHEDFRWSGCEKAGEDYYICVGVRNFFSPFPHTWNGVIGYVCGQEKTLNVTLDFTLRSVVPPVCEEFQYPYCGKIFGYNLTIFPNLLSHTSQKDADDVITLGRYYIENSKNEGLCYQHLAAFGCYSFFPECRNSSHYVPCRQMCLDAMSGCADFLKAVNQPTFCGFYPPSLDNNICLYEPISCGKPERTEFGSIITHGYYLMNSSQYFCNSGYELQGDSKRYCMYSGKWNGSIPVCVQQTIGSGAIITISILSVLLAILLMLCIYFRGNIKQLILNTGFISNMMLSTKRTSKKLFITYSSQDTQDIEIILPEMRNELQGWNIITYQQDFPAGENLLNCINQGVWRSDAILVYLTSNYVLSEWCDYEFTEARTRSALEPGFKCIVILKEGTGTDFLETLPGSFKQYVKSRIYLIRGEKLFWNKLRGALK